MGVFLQALACGPLQHRAVAFFGGVSHWEMLVILLVILLVFGRRVPEVMRSLGRGVTQFKKGLRDVEDEVQRELDESDKPTLTGSGRQAPPAGAPSEPPKGGVAGGSKELEG